jgi:hypothetical protein
MRLNGPISREDGWRVALVKAAKSALGAPGPLAVLETIVAACGRAPLPEQLRWRLFRLLIGLHIRRGWREGLRATPVSVEP